MKKTIELFKFGLVGLLNTIITYILYLFLLDHFPYSLAYTISYVAGIIISYFFNTIFVFKQSVSLSNFLKFPVVYLVQYLLNLLLMFVVVNKLLINEKIALIISIAVTFPITFVLSKYVLKSKKE
ncbi:GtrA family protein [Paenibacillus sp. FSL A5-0031]|uniref:GtrA family protein n=1 Tax=Paenibacillus sp. FSL A5-0031 TaxID=1920420 RepID=UPI002116C868|nr:GtrA family protein [Paenibacillus sp. FSL A5-0031]